ncbi:AlpA family transcriptional regulator [Ruegeria sp. HKCCD7318]|uniref:helix-turn-helix transcriptional regulator n=1 Tax=Ruegeria sp. HKCCD7318 TaxID=2683014 RepID=UPI001C10C2CA|nr:helix-turn-helix domain-containing protein [Ruegeria sp. HKCCD7318]
MPNKLLKANEMADFLQVSLDTLIRWRSQGRGPKWIKVGGTIRYFPITTGAAQTTEAESHKIKGTLI